MSPIKFKDYEEFKTRARNIAGESWGYYGGVDEYDNVVMFTETGGASGGSCWDTEDDEGATRYHVDNPERREEILDDILVDISSTLTFLDYRKIEKMIREEVVEDYEYYGNYTSYLKESISLRDIWSVIEKYHQ